MEALAAFRELPGAAADRYPSVGCAITGDDGALTQNQR